jgi:hypothetical protein
MAMMLNNLAGLRTRKGEYRLAELSMQECWGVLRSVLGDEHPYAAKSLNSFAVLLYQQGKHGLAEPYMRESLATMVRLLGAQHPDVI